MELEVGGGGDELGFHFPFWIPARRRFKAEDPFFSTGNLERELLAKQVALDLTEDERYQLQEMEDAEIHMFCPIVGCCARLNCLEGFEDHYHARHTASCSVCSRVYPTSRLLNIHVSESHDSFFQAKVSRGFPMYECLVEGCEVKLKTYRSRKQHLVDKHKFPTSYEFLKKGRASKHQRQKHQFKQAMDIEDKDSKQPKRAAKDSKQHKRTEAQGTDMEVEGNIDDLVSAVLKLSTSDSSPSSVSFGHRHARGFAFLPRSLCQIPKPSAP